MLKLEAAGASLNFDNMLGNLTDLRFGAVAPLHSAHWVGKVDDLAGLPPVERRLAGDFFCMPFGKSDLTDDPQHGYTANGEWVQLDHTEVNGRSVLRLELQVPVMGARVQKELMLQDGQPILYQRHTIIGGEGKVTLAHHPMFHMQDGGRLSFSEKRVALTPEKPLVEGRNVLLCPARSAKLSAFPGVEKSVNLHRFPIGKANEDFVTLVEAAGTKIGWTTLVRKAERDIIFVLKESAVLPVTMLWHSNGGRDYAPWSGQHVGVLGIEDGVSAGAAGHRAATQENAVRAEGVATCLALSPGKRHVVRHAMGAVAAPRGFDEVSHLELAEDRLLLTSTDGADLVLPFDADFFRSATVLA